MLHKHTTAMAHVSCLATPIADNLSLSVTTKSLSRFYVSLQKSGNTRILLRKRSFQVVA